MKKEGRLLRLLGCTKKKKTILDSPTQPTLSLPSNIHEVGSGKRGNLQDLLFLKSAQMGFSADRLFNREASVHQLLGGGIVADVILWRQRNLTVGVLSLVISVWIVFERSGYTLLSFCSSVLLLLLSILFVWAKAAALLNRPAPPLPELWLSEEQVNEVAALVRDRLNALLATSQAIALGKDSRLYFRSAAWLLLISVVSAWADLVTLGYACIIVLLTVPALYEKYEDRVDHCVISIHRSICRLYIKLDEQIAVIRKWDLEKLKLD